MGSSSAGPAVEVSSLVEACFTCGDIISWASCSIGWTCGADAVVDVESFSTGRADCGVECAGGAVAGTRVADGRTLERRQTGGAVLGAGLAGVAILAETLGDDLR